MDTIFHDAFTMEEKPGNEREVFGIQKSSEEYARMMQYSLFSGVHVIFEDIKMEELHHSGEAADGEFMLHYCYEGRCECLFRNGETVYIGKGDLAISWVDDSEYSHRTIFPDRLFKGVAIHVRVEDAQKVLDYLLGEQRLSLGTLCYNFCRDDKFYVLRGKESWMEQLFFALHYLPENMQQEYLRIKVLDIFLFLKQVTGRRENSSLLEAFTSLQIEKVKAIHRDIITYTSRRYTIDYLGKKHDISPTILKRCFKSLYGASVYQYTKNFKMHEAARQLVNTEDSILSIANRLGYENGSKFAGAFKDIIGMTPYKFRFQHRKIPHK